MKNYPPMHIQAEALGKLKDPQFKDALAELISAIRATVQFNFWLLTLQKIKVIDGDLIDHKLYLSDNFNKDNIFVSDTTIGNVLQSVQDKDQQYHARNQILISICSALENFIQELSESFGSEIAPQSQHVSSKPVRLWVGMKLKYESLGEGLNSHGFHEHCIKRLQKLFWARNAVVHKGAKWSENLEGFPTFWRKDDKVKTEQNSVDAIIQWIDNELLHAVKDIDKTFTR